MKDMKANGFQTRDIHKLVKLNLLTKVMPGLYWLAETLR